MVVWRRIALGAVVVLAANGALAAFRASDIVVVPVAAAVPGLNNSNWRTDIEIYNADKVAIDVEIVLLKTGNLDNSAWFNSIKNHLGGRDTDGFGKINTALKDIAPGATVVIEDIVRVTWGEGLKGALGVFAYTAGTLNKVDASGNSLMEPRKVIVNTHTYTLGTDGSGNAVTYGQQVPGIPWWDRINRRAVDAANGWDRFVLTGIRGDAKFRTSIGLVNTSDRGTSLSVLLTLMDKDGVTKLAETTVTLYALAHDQFDDAVKILFGITDKDVVGATLIVSIDSYISTSLNPSPGLTAYASRVDNVTNDPSFIEPAFPTELNWDCVFNSKGCPSPPAAAAAIPSQDRPFRPPTWTRQ